MTFESDKQVGWVLVDASAEGSPVNDRVQIALRTASALLWKREGVSVEQHWDGAIDRMIGKPGGAHRSWSLLMANRIPNTGMPNLRRDIAEAHVEMVDHLERWGGDLPEHLVEERRTDGLWVVPDHIALSGLQGFWVPEKYSHDGQQRVVMPKDCVLLPDPSVA